MVNYQNGKIYKIVNNVNNIVYYGLTVEKILSHTMGNHRQKSTNIRNLSKLHVALRTIGSGNFIIVLVHDFPCNSKNELNTEFRRVLDAAIAAGTPVYNPV